MVGIALNGDIFFDVFLIHLRPLYVGMSTFQVYLIFVTCLSASTANIKNRVRAASMRKETRIYRGNKR